MSKMKILITGGSGLLGQYLNIFLAKENEILTIYNNNPGNCTQFNNLKFDLKNKDGLKKIFSQFKPDIVIHTAAVSETLIKSIIPPKLVYDLNVTVTKNIAELCDKFSAKIIYTSTDLVYAGYRGSLLKEDSKLIPVSLYAETKLMGEIKIQEVFNNFIILRTALLFGFGLNHSRCHFQEVYYQLRKGIPVKLFIDQFRSPLSLIEAADLIRKLLKLNVSGEIINFGGPERLSRFELVEKLCIKAGLDKNLLVKIKLDDMPELPKVEDVSLNIDKLKSFGLSPKSVDAMISETLKQETNFHLP